MCFGSGGSACDGRKHNLLVGDVLGREGHAGVDRLEDGGTFALHVILDKIVVFAGETKAAVFAELLDAEAELADFTKRLVEDVADLDVYVGADQHIADGRDVKPVHGIAAEYAFEGLVERIPEIAQDVLMLLAQFDQMRLVVLVELVVFARLFDLLVDATAGERGVDPWGGECRLGLHRFRLVAFMRSPNEVVGQAQGGHDLRGGGQQ